MYIVFYETKSHRARKHRRPLPSSLKFSVWSLLENLRHLLKYSGVILSSLEDPVPSFSCICSCMKQKDIGLGYIEGPYPGPWNFQGGVFRIIYAHFKNIVMLSSLVWKIRSHHFYVYIWSSMKGKVIGLGNIEGSYPGVWNFQAGIFGTIYVLLKYIAMLFCLVWKIRFPHFYVYGLLWSEMSSSWETSNTPTQGPENFRLGLRGQSPPPVKIKWCYLV